MMLEGDTVSLGVDKPIDVKISRVFSFKWAKVSYSDDSAEWVRTSAVTEKEK